MDCPGEEVSFYDGYETPLFHQEILVLVDGTWRRDQNTPGWKPVYPVGWRLSFSRVGRQHQRKGLGHGECHGPGSLVHTGPKLFSPSQRSQKVGGHLQKDPTTSFLHQKTPSLVTWGNTFLPIKQHEQAAAGGPVVPNKPSRTKHHHKSSVY